MVDPNVLHHQDIANEYGVTIILVLYLLDLPNTACPTKNTPSFVVRQNVENLITNPITTDVVCDLVLDDLPLGTSLRFLILFNDLHGDMFNAGVKA